MKRRIAVVTVGRSDYGIYTPILRKIIDDPDCELALIVGGAHLDARYGRTVQEIEREGYPIAARVRMIVADDSRQSVADAMGAGIAGFARAYSEVRPDIVLVLGDRYEMMAAATAALPLRIPLAHLHGGELTLGAIDDAIRHCITKLSHLHFAAAPDYARRIRQMGEEPWRVHVTGSPVVDAVLALDPIPQSDLEKEIGLDLSRSLLITYHPVTLADNAHPEHISALLEALAEFDLNFIFTYPNADAGNADIVEQAKQFVARTPNARMFFNLGHRKYHSLQRHVLAMVGNSSSGIIEAASFRLPVVNIGSRQAGRMRTANILDATPDRESIAAGIRRATSPEFRATLTTLSSPYGEGDAAAKIVHLLKSVDLGGRFLVKQFQDLPVNTGEECR